MTTKNCNKCIHISVCSKSSNIKNLVNLLYTETGGNQDIGYADEVQKWYGYMASECKYYNSGRAMP